MDVLVAQTLVFLPFFLLGADLQNRIGELTPLAILFTWYPRFYHANVRARMGPLRYIFVTPQSHRIHHSLRREQADRNFGVILCLWDRIFGTHCDAPDEYPPVGVRDRNLPLEDAAGAWPPDVVGTYLRQITYPFRRMRPAGDS